MKSIDQDELKKLYEELEVSEIGIELDKEDASAYFKKASVLVKIFSLTKDNKYIVDIRKCYDKAIELAPKNGVYLIDRSKFFVSIGENNLAVDDIKKLKNLPEHNNYVLETYIKDTVENIIRLDAIQELIGVGKKDQDLLG